MKKISLRATALAVATLATTSAFATDGYFPHGYGMKSLGMGGASVAMTDNAFAGANNPATAAFAGNRVDLGVNIFMPSRGVDENFGQPYVDSGSKTFLVPEFGYNKSIDAQVSAGVTVYGNGGMNTDYAAGKILSFSGSGATGVNLMQLIVAPTIAYKLNEASSVGVSPLLVYQMFKAQGLGAFAGYSSDGSNLSDKGNDSSTGLGVRVGYYSALSDVVSVGASYSPKTKMSKFGSYAGLFAGGGSFDIPENYSLGASIKATDSLKVALDYERINYSGVPAISNPSTNLTSGAALGAANGPGFGWSDVNVFKIGAEWQYSPTVILRVGFNSSTNPVQSRDVTFNILAPGVVTRHYTFGGTYQLQKDAELTWAYMRAPKNSVTGNHLLGATTNQTISMSQQSLGVQYSWKF